MQKHHRPSPSRHWQSHLLGLRGFPEDLTEFELAHFFSFDPATIKAIESRRSTLHRLAAAVHIGFVRMAGRSLDAFETIPVNVIARVRRELGIRGPDLASLRTLYDRDQTLFAHQRWAAQVAGFEPFNERRRRVLVAKLRKDATTTLSLDKLVRGARRWLFDTAILIPGERTLIDLARRAQADSQSAILEYIEKTIPDAVRSLWFAEIFAEHPPHATRIDWLQRPPRRRSRKTATQVMAKIEFLKHLGVHEYPLTGISLEQQRAYARRVRRRRPTKLKEIAEPQRTLEMVCFVRIMLMQLTDVLVSLTSMRGAAIFRQATEQVLSERIKPREAYRRLRQARRLADDDTLDEAELREKIRELAPVDLGHGHMAAAARKRLSESARRTRPLLKTFLELDLHTAPGAPLATAVDVLEQSYQEGRTTLPWDASASFAPRWQKLIEDKNRRQAMRAFEAATIQQLRHGLRNGTLWVSDSLKYRNRDDILLSSATWEATRTRHFRRLKLPLTAKRHVAPLLSSLEAGLAALAEAVSDEVVSLDDDELHLRALTREDVPDDVDRIRRALVRDLGTVQLPDLIVEMDSRVRFSWELLGRPARSEQELHAVYAGILAHGTGANATATATATATAMMVPEVARDVIAAAMQHLEDERALKRANALLVEFLLNQPLAKMWGAGTMASADAMSLEASRHLWNARVDPRHRRHAIGMYTHVLDQWGIIYDQPLVLGERQAGAAIEGMIRQTASVDLDLLAVDTHGYTDFAMGLSRLLGFDLCPRLKNLKQRRLHLPKTAVVPELLAPIIDHDVDLDIISAGWDGLVRVASSIETGCTPATLALERFGLASRGDPIYEAGVALGRLRRSLFMCDFATNPTFRRELLRVLNYGESIHALQRAVHPGRVTIARGRRLDELVAISGSLSLISNMVMAWTAGRLQRVLDSWRRQGRAIPDGATLRHVAPTQFGGINFRGLFHFPVRRYASRLLAGSG